MSNVIWLSLPGSNDHNFMLTNNTVGLHDYQVEAKDKIYAYWQTRNYRVMLQLPTGTGKTHVFASIAEDFANAKLVKKNEAINDEQAQTDHDFCVLILVHRIEIVRQINALFEKHGYACEIIHDNGKKELAGALKQGLKPNCIQIATIQTFQRLKTDNPILQQHYALLIIDEAHHALARTYKDTVEKLNKLTPHLLLGVTATPWRYDGGAFSDDFDRLVTSHPIRWFIEHHKLIHNKTPYGLASYNYYTVNETSALYKKSKQLETISTSFGDFDETELAKIWDDDEVTAKIYASYEQFAAGQKGIIYAINKAHADHLLREYQAHHVAIAKIVSGETSEDERDQILEDFKNDKLSVIVNVDIFSEGFDCPDIDFIQLARPTRSLTKYLQQIGRGLRYHPGKTLSIIDNVGLFFKLGSPCELRNWQKYFNGWASDLVSFESTNSTNFAFWNPQTRSFETTHDEMGLVERAEDGHQLSANDDEHESLNQIELLDEELRLKTVQLHDLSKSLAEYKLKCMELELEVSRLNQVIKQREKSTAPLPTLTPSQKDDAISDLRDVCLNYNQQVQTLQARNRVLQNELDRYRNQYGEHPNRASSAGTSSNQKPSQISVQRTSLSSPNTSSVRTSSTHVTSSQAVTNASPKPTGFTMVKAAVAKPTPVNATSKSTIRGLSVGTRVRDKAGAYGPGIVYQIHGGIITVLYDNTNVEQKKYRLENWTMYLERI